jgi:hypothetical protein
MCRFIICMQYIKGLFGHGKEVVMLNRLRLLQYGSTCKKANEKDASNLLRIHVT